MSKDIKVKENDSLKLTIKRHPFRGILATILAVVSIVMFFAACIFSGVNGGHAAFFVGIMGFVSLIISAIGAFLAWTALRESDIYYVFPSIGGILNALLVVFYIVVYIWGFYL
ncbi:MAG: DUF6142 family protein [Lachnospiraceae bacterium]|nr:DUF6142 family protein [Lachnospiraceae bacterium]